MKPRTYIFIFLLVLIVVFVIGVRYGQQVERANKVIDYLLKLTPTPTQLPTPTPFEYKTVQSKRWGLKFTYPSFLNMNEDPTKAAILFEFPKNSTPSP